MGRKKVGRLDKLTDGKMVLLMVERMVARTEMMKEMRRDGVMAV
jgi:hypothetical protein